MDNLKICVVGLGYVGLPLAVELAKYFPVTGFDINRNRIETLQNNSDPTGEVSTVDLKNSSMTFSSDNSIINKSNFIIIAVPTPIDRHKNPDLTPLLKASQTVGSNLSKGSIVVYESTVFPGATEENCVPVLEQFSNLKWKQDFFVGYSPERINPGDKVHTFATIVKVVSGDSESTLKTISKVYGSAVKAGIYKASSIKVAEAAKVIENTQRDINIALMNELKIIFDKMSIPTKDVLAASGTKWNFLPFEPGLVGGHCIGVDPYYLAFKAEEIGHHPQIIMAGRRINDAMGKYYARTLIKKMIEKNITIKGSNVLICGITFKEDVPDIRNTKVVDIINELIEFGIYPDVWDPVADNKEVLNEYNITICDKPKKNHYHAIILAVKHSDFISIKIEEFRMFLQNRDGIFYDIKDVFN